METTQKPEYNTQRDKLKISEYGRNLQLMAEHLLEIEDRAKRTEAATMIVSVMAQMNPQVRESNDYLHKLWDHIHIISGYRLDVDGPYPAPTPEEGRNKPEHIGYHKNNIRHGHYGKIIKEMIDEAVNIEDEEKRQAVAKAIANQMKRDFLGWNRDTVNNQVIFDDLKEMSDGKLSLPEDTMLTPSNEILGKMMATQPTNNINRKKKKKKKTNRPKDNMGF